MTSQQALRYLRKLLTLVALVFLALGCAGVPSEGAAAEADGPPKPPPDSALYLDPAKVSAERAADLLSYMSLEEKLGQMLQVDRQFLVRESHITEYGIGSVLGGGGSVPTPNTAEAWADMIDSYQQHALDTRLGIPLLYGTDAVHGHNNLAGATIFPHNIGLGAADNPELTEEIARITAVEAAAVGVNWSFSPSVAVPQDIRWGRTYEGFSEDPALVARLGAAYVRGMQGSSGFGGNSADRPASGPAAPDTIMTTVKHFIGDGATAGGRDQGDVPMPLEEVVKRFGSPYRSAIEAGTGAIMASFNSIQGTKVHGSEAVLTGQLRDELGFEGLIVSDWAAIRQLPGGPMAQLARSVNAGIDMIMIPDDYAGTFLQLKGAVLSEDIPMERVDQAVLRILEAKFALGLFENPFAKRHFIPEIGSLEHRAVARRAVQESLVVLKNENDVLPLGNEELSLLVVGERADDIGSQSGGWTLTWQGFRGNKIPGTTLVDALQDRAHGSPESGAGGASLRITYRPDGSFSSEDTQPDLVIVVLGEDPYAEMQGDSGTLALPSKDLEVFRRAAQVGAPLVTVILSGRPVMINEVLSESEAVVAAWLPGTEAAGVIDVLFGAAPAAGTLPYTWPEDVSSVPIQSTEPAPGVLFPRGFGVTYEAGGKSAQ